MIKRTILGLLAAGALAGSMGCTYVTTSMPSATNVTGEAWYTEATGFFGLYWGSRVYYCPAPTEAGRATCKEAKLVPLPEKK